MLVSELKHIDCIELVTNIFNDKKISEFYISDLFSNVITRMKVTNMCLITTRVSINSIAIAKLQNMACIIFCESLQIDEELISKAKEQEVTIFKTSKTSFELAKELMEHNE